MAGLLCLSLGCDGGCSCKRACGEGFRLGVVVWAASSFDWKGSIITSLWKVYLNLTRF